jgi:opacity protein-like surface antigen
MKRFACVAVVCLLATFGIGAVAAEAQTPPPMPGSDPKMYAEFNFGPTLGHKSDTFFGGEFGLRVADGLYVIVEASHMGNVGTSALDSNAATIANAIGGTATTALKVNHGAVGLRYNIAVSPKVHPYVLAAVGAAQVQTQVQFSVNGTTIDPASVGVQLGGDLSGIQTKTIIVIGFGVNVPFMTRFFADLGYRYGQILAKTSVVETDTSIPTQRVVLGIGMRF